MTPTQAIKHNASVLLPRMRGMPKDQRRVEYAKLRVGPLAGMQSYIIKYLLANEETPIAPTTPN